MAGFNPFAALLQAQQRPQRPAPQQAIGPQLGVQQLPGTMPYRPNAAADALSAVAPLITSVVEGYRNRKQNEENKTRQEVDTALRYRSLGIPVDEQKLAQQMKKLPENKVLAWDKPAEQPGSTIEAPGMAQPQQQAMPQIPMDAGMDSAPAVAAQPSAPQIATEKQSLPGFSPKKVAQPEANGLRAIAQKMGLVQAQKPQYKPEESQAWQGIQSMFQQGDQARAMQSRMAMQDFVLKQLKAQEEAKVAEVSLRSLGVNPATGERVSVLEQNDAMREMAVYKGKMDPDTDPQYLAAQYQRNTGKPLPPEDVERLSRSILFAKGGADKVAKAETDLFNAMVGAGVPAREAAQQSKRVLSGEPLDGKALSRMNIPGLLQFAQKAQEMYPTAPPKVLERANHMALVGMADEAMQYLAMAGGPSGAAADLGIKQGQLANQVRQTDIAQQQADIARARLALERQKESREQSSFTGTRANQLITQMRETMAQVKDGKLTQDQANVLFDLMSSASGGAIQSTAKWQQGMFSSSMGREVTAGKAFPTGQGSSASEAPLGSIPAAMKTVVWDSPKELLKFIESEFIPALSQIEKRRLETQGLFDQGLVIP